VVDVWVRFSEEPGFEMLAEGPSPEGWDRGWGFGRG